MPRVVYHKINNCTQAFFIGFDGHIWTFSIDDNNKFSQAKCLEIETAKFMTHPFAPLVLVEDQKRLVIYYLIITDDDYVYLAAATQLKSTHHSSRWRNSVIRYDYLDRGCDVSAVHITAFAQDEDNHRFIYLNSGRIYKVKFKSKGDIDFDSSTKLDLLANPREYITPYSFERKDGSFLLLSMDLSKKHKVVQHILSKKKYIFGVESYFKGYLEKSEKIKLMKYCHQQSLTVSLEKKTDSEMKSDNQTLGQYVDEEDTIRVYGFDENNNIFCLLQRDEPDTSINFEGNTHAYYLATKLPKIKDSSVKRELNYTRWQNGLINFLIKDKELAPFSKGKKGYLFAIPVIKPQSQHRYLVYVTKKHTLAIVRITLPEEYDTNFSKLRPATIIYGDSKFAQQQQINQDVILNEAKLPNEPIITIIPCVCDSNIAYNIIYLDCWKVMWKLVLKKQGMSYQCRDPVPLCYPGITEKSDGIELDLQNIVESDGLQTVGELFVEMIAKASDWCYQFHGKFIFDYLYELMKAGDYEENLLEAAKILSARYLKRYNPNSIRYTAKYLLRSHEILPTPENCYYLVYYHQLKGNYQQAKTLAEETKSLIEKEQPRELLLLHNKKLSRKQANNELTELIASCAHAEEKKYLSMLKNSALEAYKKSEAKTRPQPWQITVGRFNELFNWACNKEEKLEQSIIFKYGMSYLKYLKNNELVFSEHDSTQNEEYYRALDAFEKIASLDYLTPVSKNHVYFFLAYFYLIIGNYGKALQFVGMSIAGVWPKKRRRRAEQLFLLDVKLLKLQILIEMMYSEIKTEQKAQYLQEIWKIYHTISSGEEGKKGDEKYIMCRYLDLEVGALLTSFELKKILEEHENLQKNLCEQVKMFIELAQEHQKSENEADNKIFDEASDSKLSTGRQIKSMTEGPSQNDKTEVVHDYASDLKLLQDYSFFHKRFVTRHMVLRDPQAKKSDHYQYIFALIKRDFDSTPDNYHNFFKLAIQYNHAEAVSLLMLHYDEITKGNNYLTLLQMATSLIRPAIVIQFIRRNPWTYFQTSMLPAIAQHDQTDNIFDVEHKLQEEQFKRYIEYLLALEAKNPVKSQSFIEKIITRMGDHQNKLFDASEQQQLVVKANSFFDELASFLDDLVSPEPIQEAKTAYQILQEVVKHYQNKRSEDVLVRASSIEKFLRELYEAKAIGSDSGGIPISVIDNCIVCLLREHHSLLSNVESSSSRQVSNQLTDMLGNNEFIVDTIANIGRKQYLPLYQTEAFQAGLQAISVQEEMQIITSNFQQMTKFNSVLQLFLATIRKLSKLSSKKHKPKFDFMNNMLRLVVLLTKNSKNYKTFLPKKDLAIFFFIESLMANCQELDFLTTLTEKYKNIRDYLFLGVYYRYYHQELRKNDFAFRIFINSLNRDYRQGEFTSSVIFSESDLYRVRFGINILLTLDKLFSLELTEPEKISYKEILVYIHSIIINIGKLTNVNVERYVGQYNNLLLLIELLECHVTPYVNQTKKITFSAAVRITKKCAAVIEKEAIAKQFGVNTAHVSKLRTVLTIIDKIDNKINSNEFAADNNSAIAIHVFELVELIFPDAKDKSNKLRNCIDEVLSNELKTSDLYSIGDEFIQLLIPNEQTDFIEFATNKINEIKDSNNDNVEILLILIKNYIEKKLKENNNAKKISDFIVIFLEVKKAVCNISNNKVNNDSISKVLNYLQLLQKIVMKHSLSEIAEKLKWLIKILEGIVNYNENKDKKSLIEHVLNIMPSSKDNQYIKLLVDLLISDKLLSPGIPRSSLDQVVMVHMKGFIAELAVIIKKHCDKWANDEEKQFVRKLNKFADFLLIVNFLYEFQEQCQGYDDNHQNATAVFKCANENMKLYDQLKNASVSNDFLQRAKYMASAYLFYQTVLTHCNEPFVNIMKRNLWFIAMVSHNVERDYNLVGIALLGMNMVDAYHEINQSNVRGLSRYYMPIKQRFLDTYDELNDVEDDFAEDFMQIQQKLIYKVLQIVNSATEIADNVKIFYKLAKQVYDAGIPNKIAQLVGAGDFVEGISGLVNCLFDGEFGPLPDEEEKLDRSSQKEKMYDSGRQKVEKAAAKIGVNLLTDVATKAVSAPALMAGASAATGPFAPIAAILFFSVGAFYFSYKNNKMLKEIKGGVANIQKRQDQMRTMLQATQNQIIALDKKMMQGFAGLSKQIEASQTLLNDTLVREFAKQMEFSKRFQQDMQSRLKILSEDIQGSIKELELRIDISHYRTIAYEVTRLVGEAQFVLNRENIDDNSLQQVLDKIVKELAYTGGVSSGWANGAEYYSHRDYQVLVAKFNELHNFTGFLFQVISDNRNDVYEHIFKDDFADGNYRQLQVDKLPNINMWICLTNVLIQLLEVKHHGELNKFIQGNDLATIFEGGLQILLFIHLIKINIPEILNKKIFSAENEQLPETKASEDSPILNTNNWWMKLYHVFSHLSGYPAAHFTDHLHNKKSDDHQQQKCFYVAHVIKDILSMGNTEQLESETQMQINKLLESLFVLGCAPIVCDGFLDKYKNFSQQYQFHLLFVPSAYSSEIFSPSDLRALKN